MTNPPPQSFPDNQWADIPATTDGTRLPAGAHIVHRVLTLLPKPGEPLRYLPMSPVTRPPFTNIEDYAKHLIAHPSEVGVELTETPLDIDPGYNLPSPRHCYLLLELHHDVNWEYAEGSQGVSAKQAGYENEDSGLTFVTKGGVFESPAHRVPPGCRILYWSVLKRTQGVFRGFNFHIATYQDSRAGIRRLPTIFDPNIPNGGGASVP